MSPDAEISVLIATIPGRAAFLTACLESIARQTLKPVEVVVAAEGEDPAWASIRERFSDRLPLRWISLSGPSGRAGPAKTSALQAAQGTYIALIDDDDVAVEDRLAYQVAILQKKNVDWTAGRMLVVQQGIPVRTWPRGIPEGPITFSLLYEHPFIPYSTVMMTRKVRDLLRFFRTDLPVGPDYEAWLRLAAHPDIAGWFSHRILGIYRHHHQNVSIHNRTQDHRNLLREETTLQILELHRQAHPHPEEARRRIRRQHVRLARWYAQQGQPHRAAHHWNAAFRESRKLRDGIRALASRFQTWIPVKRSNTVS